MPQCRTPRPGLCTMLGRAFETRSLRLNVVLLEMERRNAVEGLREVENTEQPENLKGPSPNLTVWSRRRRSRCQADLRCVLHAELLPELHALLHLSALLPLTYTY
jgi:hypothetical protein